MNALQPAVQTDIDWPDTFTFRLIINTSFFLTFAATFLTLGTNSLYLDGNYQASDFVAT